MKLDEQTAFFDRFVDAQRDIMLKKGNDYSDHADRLSNFKRVAEALNMTPEKVCLVLVMVKVVRLDQLLASGRFPQNESIEDSFTDLGNYNMLLAMIRAEKMKE